MNVAQQLELTYKAIEGHRDLVGSALHPFADLLAYYSEAYLELNRAHRILTQTERQNSKAAVSGSDAFLYDRPTDLLDHLVLGVRVLGADGSFKNLDRVGAEWAEEHYGDYANTPGTTGAAVWWTDSETGKIGIAPPIGSVITDAVQVRYVKIPETLSRIVVSDTYQWSITNGTASFTFTAGFEPLIGEIAIGDEIGAGSETAPPLRYSRIATLTDDGTNLTGGTLTANWTDPTQTDKVFVAAQVPEILNRAESDRTRWIPIHWAISQAVQVSNPSVAQFHANEFLRKMQQAAPSHKGLRLKPDSFARRGVGWISTGR